MTATYATPEELADFLGISKNVPSRDIVGGQRVKENIGTATAIPRQYYVDNAYIVSDSFELSHHGTTAVNATALTRNTHYTLDSNDGIVNLTATGTALVGTNNLYASYVHTSRLLTNTELQNALNRAQEEVDSRTNNHFATSTDTTPDWKKVSDEKQTGKGRFNRNYFTKNRPIPDISTDLTQTATTSSQSVYVASTNGFPSTGVISFGTNKVTYTRKNATAFGGVTGISTSVGGGLAQSAFVFPYVVEMSTDEAGSDPTWTVLEKDVDYDLDFDTGKVHVYRDSIDTSVSRIYYDSAPPRQVPNRFRVSYIWGSSSIPNDLKKLTLMISSKDVMHKAVRKAHVTGRNDFKPEVINVDDDIIEDLMERFRQSKISTL